jgi:hypothetical protein
MAYQGAPNYVDIARMHEPGFWGPQPNTQKDTYNNLYALSQAESISTGSAQGYAQKIAEYLGMGPNEFQDYSLGAFQRGILMGQKDDPLAPVEFGASQLTPEVQDNLRSILSKLLPIAKQEPQDPENPTPTQKRVNAMMYQLAYAKASEVTKTDLGFSMVDAFRSQAEVYGKILNAYTYGAAGALYDGYNAAYNPTKNTKIARGIDDILKIRNRVDLTFDPAMWWSNLDPTVQQGFIENGISPSTIRTALNEDEANFRIGEIIFKSDTQKRIEAYAPGYFDSGRLIADNLVGGILNSSDTVPFIALEVAATVATGGFNLVATAGAAPAVAVASTGFTVFRAARNVASTIAKLPLGLSPTYAKNLGMLGTYTLTGSIFGVGAALQEATRQEKQIAYANALVFADPEMQKDYDLSSIGWAGGEGFAIGFLGFGLAPGVMGSTAGAFLNKLRGVNVAPLGESVVRMTGDKRFTYEGTRLGEALGFYKGKLSRKDVAVDLPLHEKIITEAELEGVKPSAQQLSNETQTAVNRADARAAVTPDAARATPDVPMTRRLDNETRQAYAERTGANGTLSNIIEFVTEISRKNSAGDAVKERASLTGTGDTFGDMGTTDRLRILYASEEHLNTTRLKEKEAGKLTPAREKAYAIMESQRRGMIKQYTKSLSKPERKALSDSLGGVKKSVKTITEHVADARSTVISSAAKNEAAEKAAVSLLGTAREIVANPTRKAELRADLPKEVLDILDAAITEVAITGTASQNMVDAMKADISGVERKPSSRLTIAVREALKIKKLNPKRTALINALKEDLSKFSSLVSGNKANAEKFYQFTNEMVDGGFINEIDQSILLASVVHLNFDSKAFAVDFRIDSIVNPDTGKPEYTTVGAYFAKNNEIVLNTSWIGNSSERRAMMVLHEIGHAYFQSSATADIYVDTLKMYNSLTRNYGPSLLNLDVANMTDPLLSSGFLNLYHLQNMEEVFVQSFSKILFTEAQLAVAQMAPIEVSSFRSILNDMKHGIILAATMFDTSEHYKVVNGLINRLTEMDMTASKAISVPELARAMADTASKTDITTHDAFNTAIKTWMVANLPDHNPEVIKKAQLTKGEFDLLFAGGKDPSLIVAMTILKSNGRQAIDTKGNLTVHMKDLVDVYSAYKQTQFGSMLIKTAWLLTTPDYKQLVGMSKKKRVEFIQRRLFTAETKPFESIVSSPEQLLAATYEDRNLSYVESTNYLDANKKPAQYAYNFWGTRADSIVEMLDKPIEGTVKNGLSETDRLALLDQVRNDPYLNQPLMHTLKDYYKNNGFADIAHLVTLVHHKHYIDTLKAEGVFDNAVLDRSYLEQVVQTPEFKEFFGKSKAVDANGVPIIVYHGTTTLADFNEFKVGGGIYGSGIYTSTNTDTANVYALVNPRQPNIPTGARLFPLFISIAKPLVLDFSKTGMQSVEVIITGLLTKRKLTGALELFTSAVKAADEAQKTKLTEAIDLFAVVDQTQIIPIKTRDQAIAEAVEALGYDGFKVIMNAEDTYWIALKPEQVKSVYNEGTFSKLTPDIRKDMDLPVWSSKDIAIDSIAAFLSNKDITHLAIDTLARNLDPVLLQKLTDIPNMTPERVLAGIHKMIETGAIVLNETSGKWELPTTKKPKGTSKAAKAAKTPKAKKAVKAKEAKVKEAATLAAISDGSEELTLANLDDIIVKLAGEKKLNSLQLSKMYDRIEYIRSKIEAGTLQTEKQLINLASTMRRKEFISEKRKGKGGKNAQQGQTAEGETLEGSAPKQNAGKFVPTTEKEFSAIMFDRALTWNNLTNNTLLTPEEVTLAKALLSVESDKELASKSAELLGKKVEDRTIGNRRNALYDKMVAIGKAIEYSSKDPLLDTQDSLLAHVKQMDQVVTTAVEKPTPVKKIVKQAEDAPAPKPVSTPVDAGSRLLENQALAAKLKKKDPAPVITPVTKVEEGTLFRATSEATGNTPEAVLRPEKQVDAIIENSEVSTKEAVSFVPKKPLPMTMTAAEFMANEVKMASTMKVADRMGVDALVFSDGVVMPTQANASVVVKGVTETKVKAGVPSVTKIKVKKGVPVQTVTAVVEPPKVEVVEPTTTPAPAVAPVEDLPSTPVPPAANDGAPVRVTKTGGIAPPAPRKTVSEVVKTTETERIERVVNDDKDLLRDNGMDQGFLKLFLKNYWTRMKNIDKAVDTYSPTLLSLWTKFVTINKAIVEANRAVFGDEGISKFWIAVDKLRAENVQKLATVPGFKSLSERQLMVLAAKEVGDAYMPPILLDELNIVKSSEDATAFTLVAKESKTPRKKVSDATKAESPVPVPPEPTPAPAPKAGEEVPVTPETIPLEPIKETPRGDMGRIINTATKDSEQSASVLLRQGSLIGAIFGGSERASRNWWRAMNSWMANATQAASQTGKTIRNLQKNIRFLSRLFEDNRAQSGHLVGAGKEAFRTARQCKSDEARMITRIARQQLLLNKKLKDSGLALDKVRAVGVLSYTKLSEGTIIAPADLVALGLSPDLAKSIAVEANSLLQITRQTNQTILGLQNETGLFNSNAADGTPLDPMKYAPVQLNHESFSAMSPTDRALFVAGLVKARRTRKLKSPILDINTLIVLGWLDVAPSKEARGTDLFAGKRDFRPGESTQSFSPETLKGLFVSEHPITVGEKGVLAKLANGAESQKHFVLTDPKSGIIRLYRMPTVISELADADRVRYIEAVNGNKSLYTQRWQDYLKGRELIEVEMNEMLDFKTKKGAYSEYQRNTGTNIDRPLMVVDASAETALSVPGLIPEEVLSDPVILKHIRTNLAESYNYFMNGRVFELIFQRELDRLMGSRNVRITDVFPHVASEARRDIEAIAKAENWTPGQLAARLQDVTEGIQRLKDEYASNADTLPMLPYQDQAAARSLLALMKIKVASGYYLGAMTELIMETLKSNPLHLPGNLISTLRFVVGDFRVSKNSLMNNSELGDMIFGLENIKYEFSSRFLGEANQGAFELDSTIGSKIKSKFINPRPATGLVDRGVRVLESGARVAETIGSLQAITNITRSMAKVRLQRMIYGHIKKGRIQKLLTALEDPAMMKLMQDYMAAAETSAGAENQLRKQFYALARKTGFGFNPKEALVFMKYGLNSVEKIKHLEYLIKKVDKKGEGRVNLHNMVDVYWHATTHPVDGIKPEVLEQAISSYGLALEDLVVKTSTPEPIGLGRVTTIDSKTPLGKLWYALSSYIRGFQDNVIMDYGSRDTLRYLAANIVLYGTLDATIGLLREWIAGRDGEDILEEFSDNPHAFAVRVAKSAPIMGMWSGALEAGLSGLSYMSGGTWKYYGSPMQSIGMGAATSAVEGIGRGVSEVVEGVTGDEEVDYMKVAKGVGDITSVNSLLNRSPIAVAARSLEVSGALEEKGTLQTYMNMIHRNPHPYAKSQGRKQSSSQSLPPIPKVAPRNFELEAQALKKARAAQAGVRYEDMSKGVSGSLGDLLDDAQ